MLNWTGEDENGIFRATWEHLNFKITHGDVGSILRLPFFFVVIRERLEGEDQEEPRCHTKRFDYLIDAQAYCESFTGKFTSPATSDSDLRAEIVRLNLIVDNLQRLVGAAMEQR